MIIKLITSYTNKNYFSIIIGNTRICSSKNIANLLNLDINIYNRLLIEKVIQHNKYSMTRNELAFSCNNVSKEVYIKRFKDVFSNQLILLTLGGGSNEN